MREWTSVEDGLPEPYKDCWITYEFASGSRNVTESYVNDKGRWDLAASKASRKVIAWMYRDGKPLPYGENKDEFEEG